MVVVVVLCVVGVGGVVLCAMLVIAVVVVVTVVCIRAPGSASGATRGNETTRQVAGLAGKARAAMVPL